MNSENRSGHCELIFAASIGVSAAISVAILYQFRLTIADELSNI